MAYYCGECAIWQGSSDANSYGERWCSYSRRYEKSNQNTYGCRGFVYAQRAVLTKVCQILNEPTEAHFCYFDEAKEAYVVPYHMDMLVNYCAVGSKLASKLENASAKIRISQQALQQYILPAEELCAEKEYEKAVSIYVDMVKFVENAVG